MEPDLPNITELDTEQLLSLRGAIDARLAEIRSELIAEAERLGAAMGNGAEKRRRKRVASIDSASRDETAE